MNTNDYILSKVENHMLLEASIIDLATVLGHSVQKPISSHVFCLELGLTIEDHDKIMGRLSFLSDKTSLNINDVRKELSKIVPEITNFSDDVFNGMLRIFLKQFDISLDLTE